jgi:NADP-reducing hydrogenase subunit HndC
VEESCGKCAPCRIGNKRLHELLGQICEGKGSLPDLDRLRNMSLVIKDTSLCGLGQTSPNPVLSMLDNFREEYVAHVTHKKCPAGQCTSLMEYVVNAENCLSIHQFVLSAVPVWRNASLMQYLSDNQKNNGNNKAYY